MRVRVVITLVLALLLASCGDDEGGVFSTGTTGAVSTSAGSETTGGGVTTTTGATTTSTQATTTTSIGPAGLAWARISHDAAVFGPPAGETTASMAWVTVGGPGLAAVGYEGDSETMRAAVWTSADGLAWTRVPYDEAVFGSAAATGTTTMSSVVAGGPGLVAVGAEWGGEDQDGAVWTSADGLTWSRVQPDEAVFGGYDNQVIESVAAGGPGLVAVGWDHACGESDAAVWVSADGLAWTRVSDAALGGAGDQVMWGVAAGGPGLVAVGGEFLTDNSAAVWTSVDGLTWSRVPPDEAVFGGPDSQSMESVAAGGPGLVAVGYDYSGGDADGAVWTSADGLAWARVPHDEAVFGGDGAQSISGVVAGGPGLVAVGGNFLGEDGAPLVWWSSDGAAWNLLPADEAMVGEGWASMWAVVVGGPGLVAVGDGGIAVVTNAAVWVSPPGG
jgi:hypothetical protein